MDFWAVNRNCVPCRVFEQSNKSKVIMKEVELSATYFTQSFYRSGLLSQSDASIWALCGFPESCQQLFCMLPTLQCQFILGLHHSSHKVLYVRTNDDPLLSLQCWSMETLHILKPFSFLIHGHHRIYHQPNLSVKWRCEEPLLNVWLCGGSRCVYTWQCY